MSQQLRLTALLCTGFFIIASSAWPPVLAADPIAVSAESADNPQTEPDASRPEPHTLCQSLATAAADNGLPVDFFARLIWQESRFKADAISRAGAQGVAQFMPGTAKLRGLEDPFDVPTAIASSAALLRDLHKQFGNLGLAAAAYNA